MSITPVILCGGSGTRLWPMSRGSYPKQFLPLVGEGTLLQQTTRRFVGLTDITSPILVSNQEQRFLVAEQLKEVGIHSAHILLEPVARNTAPAVAAAAFLALESNQDAVLLVMPSDHVIKNDSAFTQVVLKAFSVAQQGKLVTFGMTPTEPHTGYGYIQRDKPLDQNQEAFSVKAFIEKPDLKKAQELFATGDFFWNSGIFMFRADRYLQELKKFNSTMLDSVQLAIQQAKRDVDFIRLEEKSFSASPSDSIDYAVMEHTDAAAVIIANELGWSDVGSWTALADITEKDSLGNNAVGDVFLADTKSTYVRADQRMVAVIGVEDLIVVETADAVLVTHKNKSQDVKKVVEFLQKTNRSESITHRRVYRPWGWYEGLDNSERFQVKRILVNPGRSLSLQMHHHRAEHWIVVKGSAVVVNGEQELLLTENQSTYIPLGIKHRLINPGKIPLEIIEVQSGSYLGEDDIVRFEDVYGRAGD